MLGRPLASSPLFARSIDEWERAARSWLEDPDRDRGLMLLSVVVESDPVWGDAAVLRDAFELTCALRMEHQVEQLRAGEAPDNLIDPKRLTPLTRTSLKEAFRAVAKVQRGIGAKQGFTWR
jgi:signal-transduction protein with cAMP-binding, CBS, and nucleotidyltransferase domain